MSTLTQVYKERKDQANGTRALGATPEIIDWGHFLLIDSKKIDLMKSEDPENYSKLIKENSYSYMIMPQLGLTLYELFCLRKGKFSTESIYSLGIQILNIL